MKTATSVGRRLRLLALAALALSFSVAADSLPEVIHSRIGSQSEGVAGSLKMTVRDKRQQYSGADRRTFDLDINSPKSVTFSRDGRRFYVNSLEGCRTVVYSSDSLKKLKVIKYEFPSSKGPLWAAPSGYYPFTHYENGADRRFFGKPVEEAWSHGGRYLWIPFYRRSFDINAQDPSAVAVIDTRVDSIVRMFETGPLPKMVAASPDGRLLAVTHWGDNTVGLLDISSDDPGRWHHLPPIAIGSKLNLDYSLTEPVNRDSKSGYLLRGTLFTPDSRYLLVSGMAGPLSVIDVRDHKYLGQVGRLYGIRHLAIAEDGMIYGSRNVAGEVVAFRLDSLVSAIERAKKAGSRSINPGDKLLTCKVGRGARTLALSPDGRYVFVACNSASALYAVDRLAMKVVDRISIDSYPVGLAISPDGRQLIVTSQGRDHRGGNAVNILDIDRPDLPEPTPIVVEEPADSVAADSIPASVAQSATRKTLFGFDLNAVYIAAGLTLLLVAVLVATFAILSRRNRRR